MDEINKLVHEYRERFQEKITFEEEQRLAQIERVAAVKVRWAQKTKRGPLIELGSKFTVEVHFREGTELLTFQLVNLTAKLLSYVDNGLLLDSKLGQAVIGKAQKEEFVYMGKDTLGKDYEIKGVVKDIYTLDYPSAEVKVKKISSS